MPQLELPVIPKIPAVEEVPEHTALGVRPHRLNYTQDKLGGVSVATFTLRPYSQYGDAPSKDITVSNEELSLESLLGYDADIKGLFPETTITVAQTFDLLTKLMICIAVRRGKMKVV